MARDPEAAREGLGLRDPISRRKQRPRRDQVRCDGCEEHRRTDEDQEIGDAAQRRAALEA